MYSETLRATADLLYQIRDPAEWCRQKLEFDPDDWQRSVLMSHSRFMVMACARQVGKSTIVAVKVTHRAVTAPNSLVLVIAPTQRQSKELMMKIKTFLRISGTELLTDNQTEVILANGSRICALPGSEDTVRGFSAVDLIVIDEAAFAANELYHTVYPMIQISRGDMVLLSSAYITDGFFYEIWTGNDERWEKYRITAYDCPRYDINELEIIRANTPEKAFKAEYLAEFVDPAGATFTELQISDAFDDEVAPLMDLEANDVLDESVEAIGV